MRKFLTMLSLGMIAAAPLASPDQNPEASCQTVSGGDYPDHPLSPRQSLRAFDTVFFGEVVVPSRGCSIGMCAGLRVLQSYKGNPGRAVLLRLSAKVPTRPCRASPFTEKGSRWVVFANQGTSPGGQRYVDAGDDSPSFAASEAPNFDLLEDRYRLVRARLDQAIEERMGRWR